MFGKSKVISNNNAVIVKIPLNKTIDIEMLNNIASGKYMALCSCSYENIEKEHKFIYPVDTGYSIISEAAFNNQEYLADFISSVLNIIEICNENNISLKNVKTELNYIFETAGMFKFVIVPVDEKNRIPIKKFVLKIFESVSKANKNVSLLIKSIKKIKTDKQSINTLQNYICDLCRNKAYIDTSSDYVDSEGETTVLSKQESDLSSEGETSILYVDNINRMAEPVYVNNPESETTVLSREGEEFEKKDDLSSEYEISVSPTYYTQQTLKDDQVLDSEGETTILSQNHSNDAFSQSDNIAVPTSSTVASSAFADIKSSDILSNLRVVIRKVSTGEEINFSKTPFVIGKSRDIADYVILNNERVSRNHAQIIIENGNCFIVDNNSTNGTIIEGEVIAPNEKVELFNASIMVIGNETFQVFIEKR